METENYKASALAFATVASAIIFLGAFHIKGLWTISNLSASIWLFWIGVSAGQRFRLPRWGRIVAILCGICLFVGLSTKYLYWWDKINWFYSCFLLFGLSVPTEGLKSRGRVGGNLALCLISAIIFVALSFIEQRSYLAMHKYADDMLYAIHTCAFHSRQFPILCFLYAFMNLALQEKVQTLMKNNVMKWECLAVCILAFLHCLLLNVIYAIDGVWSPYSGLRLIQLLLCPATIGFVAWAIITIKHRKVIPQ